MATMKGSSAAAYIIRQLFDLGVKYSSHEPSFKAELIELGKKSLVRVPDDMEKERLLQEIKHLLLYLETRPSSFTWELEDVREEELQELEELRELEDAREEELRELEDSWKKQMRELKDPSKRQIRELKDQRKRRLRELESKGARQRQLRELKDERERQLRERERQLRELKDEWERQLWKLKDALDNAEDIVDSSPYIDKEVTEKRLEYIDTLKGSMNELNVLKLSPLPEASSYGDLQRLLMDVTRQLMNSYGFMNPTLYGRDEEEEELLHHLTRRSATASDQEITPVAVLSIVGLGGFGKTSLARSVYNNPRVEEYFNLRIWVRVHTRFVVKKLTQYILTAAAGRQYEFDSLEEEEEDHTSTYDLEDDLKTTLMSSGRFLLVLDDVWNEDDMYSWESLFYLLRHGDQGSKILLTTRSQLVATMAVEAAAAMGGGEVDTNNYTVRLGALNEKYIVALVGPEAYDNVISNSLQGWPLAANMVKLLHSKPPGNYWKFPFVEDDGNSMLRHNPLLYKGRRTALSLLRSGYSNLPEHLRSCFAYCSIFPKNYEFNKKDLVFMWIALGFVRQSQYQHSPETEGGHYFDALLARFFFQPHHTSYIMHDVIHELAQSVSVGECEAFVQDSSPTRILPRTPRHLYLKSTNIMAISNKLRGCHTLRSLLLFFDGYKRLRHLKFLTDVLKQLKSLRVLCLWVNGMEVLPDEVANLKHLRYLEIHPSIRRLPKSMNRLLHLQVLKMEGWESCIDLPIGLRHLIVPSDISDMIDGIGKLCSLQEVSFTVMERSGHEIKELKDLRELRELVIRCLEKVRSSEEASMAELSDKEFLNKLELQWSSDGSGARSSSVEVNEEDKEVLEGLQPHSNIKELTIRGYSGPEFASWMTHRLLYNLEFVKLEGCSGLEHIQCLGKFPFLQYLYLKDMAAVTQICCEGGFLQLEVLEIDNLEHLEEWSGLKDGGRWCPHLCELRIANCPKMEKLPSLPYSLADLSLDNVGLTAIPTFKEGRSSSSSSDGASSSSSSISLHSLVLHMCEELMLSQGLLDALPYLRKLGIHGCSKLVEALASATVHISSLDHLSIDRPSLLWTLPYESLASVQELIISDCRGFESLYYNPSHTLPQDLSSLKILEFKGADELMSLPKLPASLEKLSIYGCNETLKNRLQKDEGIDWPKIAHIPNISIQ